LGGTARSIETFAHLAAAAPPLSIVRYREIATPMLFGSMPNFVSKDVDSAINLGLGKWDKQPRLLQIALCTALSQVRASIVVVLRLHFSK